jgi:hypothetical protein
VSVTTGRAASTRRECAGLLLIANDNGNSTWERADAAAEYDVNCQ